MIRMQSKKRQNDTNRTCEIGTGSNYEVQERQIIIIIIIIIIMIMMMMMLMGFRRVSILPPLTFVLCVGHTDKLIKGMEAF